MNLQEAIIILGHHQEWRLGYRDDLPYEPKELSQALDMVLDAVRDPLERSQQSEDVEAKIPQPPDVEEADKPICPECLSARVLKRKEGFQCRRCWNMWE
jgi:hypothetical protein